jgi:hypothetical protein
MRRAMLLIPLLLAACETPREACISNANRELSTINGLINETQRNLTRGYAIGTQQQVRTIPDTCRTQNAEGVITTYPCDQTQIINVDRPVAIDLNAERAKLDSLLERQAQMTRQLGPALAQCQKLPDE